MALIDNGRLDADCSMTAWTVATYQGERLAHKWLHESGYYKLNPRMWSIDMQHLKELKRDALRHFALENSEKGA